MIKNSPPNLYETEDKDHVILLQFKYMTISVSFRHRLLEALRVASHWRHGNNTSHATPVLPYARLAFTHTLRFLNKVGFVAEMYTLIQTHTSILAISIDTHVICLCVCVQTDLMHTLGESAALGAAGVVLWGELKFAKSEVCNVCERVVYECVCFGV